MVAKKGMLGKIAGAVGDAVHAAAAGVGLAEDSAPKPKAARKAARKATIARAKHAKKGTKSAKR